ncbi:antirestriction protein ArdA [Mycolicibacterium gilvum]|uniref:Antirestriction protein n=1 Tax=Mycolicibacterium gilvum (strain DSM 45189 / LMG 24558 / Spyr1) TaxID=278137 RepID=E6TLA8_MYCSR|nr:antirestriction protein ArdA [Mycolicibacterium gilvum]ADU00393.1 antirestriction protein [Mycolicibacterium gilvum Spyr1]
MNETHHEPTQPEPQPETEHPHEAEPTPSPAIYVASLADYNNGRLHGAWIDAARDPDEIYADIKAMLASSHEPAAEEWAIHDYEQFGRWKVSEYDAVEQVSRIAKGIAEHGYAYSAWADVLDGGDASFDTDSFREAFLGHYDSVTEYVEQMADDLGYEAELDNLPEHLPDFYQEFGGGGRVGL